MQKNMNENSHAMCTGSASVILLYGGDRWKKDRAKKERKKGAKEAARRLFFFQHIIPIE